MANANALQYGISPLHAWIRLFELCVNISKKLEIKKWQARSTTDKEICARRKTKLQDVL